MKMTIPTLATRAKPPNIPRKNKYTPSVLLAKCNPKTPPPADLALWNVAPPMGQEVM